MSDEADTFLRQHCNRLANNLCASRTCLERGNAGRPPDFNKATCVVFEIQTQLDRITSLETQLAEFNRTEPLKRGELRALREENATLRARLAELEKIAERLDQPRHHPPFHEVCACDCCNAHRDLAKWKEK